MPNYAFFADYLDQVEKAVSSLEVASDRLSETLFHPLIASFVFPFRLLENHVFSVS